MASWRHRRALGTASRDIWKTLPREDLRRVMQILARGELVEIEGLDQQPGYGS
ncbi:hypothetical protein [Amycolatopsis sp. NPDC059657]|uniref:hypothetical protein n=1 Tax=Amycolatopsis sp. NPDC059657 TaxID=3346899 RepID=UPI00366B41A6